MRQLALLCVGVLISCLGSPVKAEKVTIQVSNTSPNCRDTSVQQHRVCAKPGETIVGTPQVDITSLAGSSAIVGRFFDQNDPACYVVETRAVPNGEDCIRLPFGRPICNCRGRGWIGLNITVTTQPSRPMPNRTVDADARQAARP